MKAITQYEYGSANEENVAPKPANLTFEQAEAVRYLAEGHARGKVVVKV